MDAALLSNRARRLGARLIALTTLIGAFVVAPPVEATPAAPATPPAGAAAAGARRPLSEAALAAADARAATKALASGEPVEVVERATGTQKWLALPDGGLRLEESAVPTRVRRSDGTWADQNLTLRAVDGALRPALSVADVAFSTGGTGRSMSIRTAASGSMP